MTGRFFYPGAAILALAAVYLGSGVFGLSLAFVNASATAVWPPTGIALAALVLWGYRLWPGVFLGAFLVNIMTQGSVATTLGIAAGNTLEALAGAWLVQRFARGSKAFDQAQSIFTFVICAAVLSTAISATFGVSSLYWSGLAIREQLPTIWLTWWLGDLVSDLIVAPLVLIWLTLGLRRLPRQRLVEAAALLFAVVLAGQMIFVGRIPLGMREQSLEYLAIPPLLWAAFRFGQRGAITAACIMSAISLWGTLHNFGPFVIGLTGNPNQSLLLLQTFMGTITLTALVLSAVVSERERAEQRLQVQDAVSRVLAESPTVEEANTRILRALCEVGSWEAGTIWRIDRSANVLACIDVWHLPGREHAEFEAVTRQIRFAPGMGLPGRVWSSGRPHWIPDVTKDLDFPRAPAAAREGLHASVGFPLKLGDEVVGVIDCFRREMRPPDEDFLRMLAVIGSQLGQFMERKRVQESLRRSESLFRQLADTMPQIVWAARPDGHIEYYNRRWYEFTGFAEGRTEGNWKPILHPDDAKRCIDTYFGCIRAERPYQVEHRFKDRKTGNYRWFLGRALPVRDDSGQVIRWFGTCTDIDDVKRAEEARATLAAIVDSTEDAIIGKNLEGVVTSWNAGAERLFGYLGKEIIGQPIFRIIPPHLHEEEKGILKRLRQGERFQHCETVRIARDGRAIDVSLSISPILDPAGMIIGVSAIARDITERKKAQEALQEAKDKLAQHARQLEQTVAERTARLKESNAELQAFSYSLSHDMRAPLRAIQSFTQIVLTEDGSKIGSPGTGYLKKVISASERLDRLILDVLALSRLSQQELVMETVNLQKLVGDIIHERPELQPPRAELKVEAPLLPVWAHEASLTQGLTNLLGNAVKFVAPGVTPRVRVYSEARDGQVRLWVEDNGIGIEPEAQRKLFEMFHRVHTERQYEGTGMGLAIVRKAIERMGGQTGVESALGQGSRFWLELPKGDH